MGSFIRVFFFSLFVFIGFCFVSILAQPSAERQSPEHASAFPFIHYSENQLEFLGKDYGRSNYDKLFATIDSVEHGTKKQIHILHIGGSHIQADVWTGEVRKRLREFIPNATGARGFIFPQKLAHTNGSPNFQVQYTGEWMAFRNTNRAPLYPIGLAGVTASTFDSAASIDITLTGEEHAAFPYPQYTFTRARVFHNVDSTCFALTLADTSVPSFRSSSAGWGFTEFAFKEPQKKLELRITKTDSAQRQFVFYGASLETDEAGFVYHAIGINGSTVPAYLRCSLLPRQLALIKPDLIILSIGLNDTRSPHFTEESHERNYDELIKMLRQGSPDAAILFTTNSDNYRRWSQPNDKTLIARKATRDLAMRHNAAVWDLFNIMGGLGSFKAWKESGLAKPDKVHFNREGYQLIGKLFFDSFVEAYRTRFGKRPSYTSQDTLR
jgi:lysophospholipase L1-like esterase